MHQRMALARGRRIIHAGTVLRLAQVGLLVAFGHHVMVFYQLALPGLHCLVGNLNPVTWDSN